MPIEAGATAAIISGLSTLAATGANAYMTAGRNKKQRTWQAVEAEKAYKRDIEMWNMQNAYNTPEAQMQRYEDAGLNPHLIYGQGTPGNATDQPHYRPAPMDYETPEIQLPDVMGMYFNFKRQKTEIDRIEKMNEVIDIEKANKMVEGVLKTLDAIDAEYNIGLNWGSTPGFYIDWEPISTPMGEPHPPKVYYDMQERMQNAQLRSQTLRNMGQRYRTEEVRKAVLEWQQKWMAEKVGTWQADKVNIDKDAISDRMMNDALKGLPAAQSWIKTFVPLLKSIFD